MTQQRISDDTLKALIEKATPGPWRLSPFYAVGRDGRIKPEPSPNRWQGVFEPVPGQDVGSRSSIVTVGIEGQADDCWLSIKAGNAELIARAPDIAADLSDARALLAQKDAADAARADHSTHFEGCWRHHLGCAVARIEAQDAEIAALKAERPVGLAEKNGRLAP